MNQPNKDESPKTLEDILGLEVKPFREMRPEDSALGKCQRPETKVSVPETTTPLDETMAGLKNDVTFGRFSPQESRDAYAEEENSLLKEFYAARAEKMRAVRWPNGPDMAKRLAKEEQKDADRAERDAARALKATQKAAEEAARKNEPKRKRAANGASPE